MNISIGQNCLNKKNPYEYVGRNKKTTQKLKTLENSIWIKLKLSMFILSKLKFFKKMTYGKLCEESESFENF